MEDKNSLFRFALIGLKLNFVNHFQLKIQHFSTFFSTPFSVYAVLGVGCWVYRYSVSDIYFLKTALLLNTFWEYNFEQSVGITNIYFFNEYIFG